MTDPHLIVLTGGPCSGKSSSIAFLRVALQERGWTVLTPPEGATLLMAAGFDFPTLARTDRVGYLAGQAQLLALQKHLREAFIHYARALSNDRVVILFDRAEPDNAAYTTSEEYARLIADHGGHGQVAGWYDTVIHLVTAADGAEHAYTLANNTTRVETPEQARALDAATLQAWLGHSHLVVIGNDQDFPGKLDRVLTAVLGVLGDPDPVEDERKYLLAGPPDLTALAAAGAVPVRITQAYLPLSGDGTETRVRSREHAGHTEYFLTRKTPRPDGSRIERESRISSEDYRLLLADRDPAAVTVVKTRWCLAFDGQHIEVDQVTEPVQVWLAEVELVTHDDIPRLPAWLGPHTDVTGDPAWTNAALSRAGKR